MVSSRYSKLLSRSLYNKIVIVERDSDIIALQSIKHKFGNSTDIYSPNGKVYTPFFIRLFLRLNKHLIVIIDDDNEIHLVLHKPDLEVFYGIDAEVGAQNLGMSRSVRNGNKGFL
ncbi:hypothetical protein CN392_17940 [Bacillus cereus]|uniref:hypothetical protein n=1 Tax=Bacillus cereus TaxID=1396 RepID=UPI000BF8A246|nr:hypothetical protein [Bacillus cereus]PFB33650.1 hypothetical protein CN392_17940 [Bacillus cereus]